MPELSTAAIFFAEVVKLQDRFDEHKLAWLKLQTITMMNERLADPEKALNPETLAVVCHFVAHSFVISDNLAVDVHLRGLLDMVAAMGGLDFLSKFPMVKGLLVWVVLLCTTRPAVRASSTVKQAQHFLRQSPRRELCFDASLTVEENVAINAGRGSLHRLHPFHPLKTSLQPLHSGLSKAQLRHHRAISLGHTLQPVLFMQSVLKVTVAELFQNRLAPREAIRRLERLASELGTAQERTDHSLPSPPFSLRDSENNAAVTTCAIQCTLVLVLKTLNCVRPTQTSALQVRQTIAKIYTLLLSPTPIASQIKIWALFCIIPYSSASQERSRAVKELSVLCARFELVKWCPTRAFLEKVLFCRELQERECHSLWLEVWRQAEVATELPSVGPYEVLETA